ncbi:Heterokaryon incompatibility protein 6, OR allele [Cytospora mali]|uniref:Heterokaryon incompatibility protein 6, OR allele n=1 Tax=Cytospora mali TaxID=578113 RepID=A0A194VHK8_CYTMA|nr:Heterokaryon incompatibility protein 6, OR allele [Valsa mali]
MGYQQREDMELLVVSCKSHSTSQVSHDSAISSATMNPQNESEKRARNDLYKKSVPVKDPNNITKTTKGQKSARTSEVIRLQCIDLNDTNRIQFDALSYSWGDIKYKAPILCNGVKVEVTLNCISAIYHLHRLQSHRWMQEPLTIWIDAICIDQEDEEEKTDLQVPLMGRIYANSRETYFWLGEGSGVTNQAMAYLPLGGGCLAVRAARNLRNGFTILWCIITRYWKLINSGLAEVSRRDWVDRVWTLQECILSRNGTVVCGDKAVPWIDCVRDVTIMGAGVFPIFPPEQWHQWANLVAFWLDTAEPDTHGTLKGEKRSKVLWKDVDQYRTLAEAAWNNGQKFSLCLSLSIIIVTVAALDIWVWKCVATARPAKREWYICFVAVQCGFIFLFWARGGALSKNQNRPWPPFVPHENVWHEVKRRNCTNPEDKFFGVAALIGGQPYLEAKREEDLPVESDAPENYRLGRIYTHLSVELLLKTRSLDMLLIGAYHGSHSPSWVVEWRSPANKGDEPSGPENALMYADTLGRGIWLGFRYYRRLGGLWGLSDFREFTQFRGATSDSRHRWDQQRIKRLRNLHIETQSGIEKRDLIVTGRIIAEITLVNQFPTLEAFHDVTQGLDPDQVDICTKYLLLISGLQARGEDGKPFKGQIHWREIVQQRQENVKMMWEQLERAGKPVMDIHQRLSLFISNTGTALAQCSGSDYKGFGITYWDKKRSSLDKHQSKEGDLIALIAGLYLPMVVRRNDKEDDKFDVVGPAFFGGVMNGCLWDRVSKYGLRDIVLC